MACDKNRVNCNLCDYASKQDNCPGANFWNDLCEKPLVPENEVATSPEKRNFGKLFRSLQLFLPEINLQMLSSNKVSSLKRKEIVMLLKAIRTKEKSMVAPDYINLKNEDLSRLLYKIMIQIHERN